jgi:hypothetical protein
MGYGVERRTTDASDERRVRGDLARSDERGVR